MQEKLNRATKELDRIFIARSRSGTEIDQSFGRLERIARSAGKDASAVALSPAARAVLIALRAYGFSRRLDAFELGRLRHEKSVEASARALGSRTRKLVLPENWWQQDRGHLIAFMTLSSGDEAENATLENERVPVALTARVGGGYDLHFYSGMKPQRLTASLATRLAPSAIEVLPPLPEKAGRLLDIASYVLQMVRGELTGVIAIGAVAGLLGALLPIATAIVIDQLIPGQEQRLLIEVGIALAVAALVSFLFAITHKHLILRVEGRTGLVLDAAVWDRLLKLPATFFKSYSSGDLSSRVAGASALRTAVVSVSLSATIATIFSIFYLALLSYYDIRLAAAAILIAVILAVVTVLTGVVQIKYHRRQAEDSGWLSGYVFQILQAIAKLRIAGAEDRALVRWADKYADERASILATRRIANHFTAFASLYGTLSLAVIFAGVFFISEARFTTGAFIAFLAAFASLQAAFHNLTNSVLVLMASIPDWQRALPILEAEPEVPPGAANPGQLTGDIDISNVSFAYGDGPRVLHDLSLSIVPGEHIAVVGESGSGKSTLLRILLGLERPSAGTVLFDGQDMDGLDITLVRRQIGVVTQSGRLSAGTIMDNIRGATAASHEDCFDACKAAGFENDLGDFPMGLYTPLTEGAPTLSGGQRQRILIARALVNRPRILFFDEATSALDNRTQEIVTESLNQLSITRLVIAHRLSTIRNADRILVLDKGHIIESGSFTDLMAAGGHFENMASRQII